MTTILKVIEREAKHQYFMLRRPLLQWQARKNWPVNQASGINMVNPTFPIMEYTKNDSDVNQNSAQIVNFIDFAKSKGNYVVDADGNTMLDVAGTELNPLGYNHDLFKDATLKGADYDASIINQFASDSIASADFMSLVQTELGAVAPKGLQGIHLVNSQNATGEAVKAAMLEREADGWSALYFDGSTHGSPLTLGGMICGWPKAAYPSSAAEESAILESVRSTVGEKRGSGNIVAAIVIEPTQQSTGYVASESFMNGLRSIANDFEAALIVDETSTGCGASGKGFW
jgi:4-aminobutyrate aminotransferase / (S)-3-amino-2-methylpropionate transaminase